MIRPQPAETTQQREELEIAVAPTALIGLQALAVHARNNNSSGTLLLGTSAFHVSSLPSLTVLLLNDVM